MTRDTAATADFIASFGGEHRLLQDAPIQTDVWVELARRRDAHEAARKAKPRAGQPRPPVPGNWVPLLITPFGASTAAQVAARLAEELEAWRESHPPAKPQGPGGRLPVSVPGLVLAWMTLEEVAAVALPLTEWWHVQAQDPEDRRERARELIDWLLATPAERRRWRKGTQRYRRLEQEAETARQLAEARRGGKDAMERAAQPAARPPRIHRIALDRQMSMAQDGVRSESARTIKADAARQLFNLDCSHIRWAIIDSGISVASGGFGEGEALRVELAYDFSRLTRWLALAQEREGSEGSRRALDELRASIEETFVRRDPQVRAIRPIVLRLEAQLAEARRAAQAGAQDSAPGSATAGAPAAIAGHAETVAALGAELAARTLELQAAVARAKAPAGDRAALLAEHLRIRHQAGRDFDWEMLEPVLEIAVETPPRGRGNRPDKHGTAVAGVLAADHPLVRGVCPDLKLIDLRVLSVEPRDADADRPVAGGQAVENEFIREFDVLSALKFVRYLNTRERAMFVHGVNLSLQTPHDVTAYGCGATLLCEEVDKTSNDGVVVVVASGNDGHRVTPDVKGRAVAHYVSSSITDPGNAEEAITVGSTHRRDPHRYGVSYFSGRGPTGDGRRKPDLVAPGEKIPTLTPTGGQSTEMDGTSFAAPHVSGAAAMLMARHPELIGRPRRIKQILMDSATDLGRTRDFQGAGLLDVLRAMQSI